MISFKNGPAQGANLEFQRHPYFLRVVKNSHTGKWDVLDQQNDEAGVIEIIYLYYMTEPIRNRGFVTYRSGGSRAIYEGEYTLYPLQPNDSILRNNSQYKKWCETNSCLK